ncbi:hypothetical protein PsYK624_167080 [Phanerochaete sordida]|uniref:Uncharacterized protein n=1 Tax=Phanerochaete sordida TaxID=48140 RepID=A0A9P3LNE5_9APHY|nr:hypothetical protein PsYK624_167080 [Phanerochaete sordida]
MVHRPADSRLLVNLITHEKDYTKQLHALLERSQSSLASFSAYASASSPPTSTIIIQVAGALAGADEGLRKYAASLDVWQEQLKSLKELEEEVGNVMRDREILVTRLIKASKNQKPTRDALLATSGSSSSLSFVKPEVQIGSKLAAAQSELQACESHLASKERELDNMRSVAVRTGLQARCKALVECGWQWGEMGKEGIRALETLGSAEGMNGHALSPSELPYSRPLPDSGTSDLSSIGPSQSASQNIHSTQDARYTLNIPAAHAISDHVFPNGTAAPLPQVDEGGGSSDSEEGQYEVRENDRFSTAPRRTQTKGKRADRSPAASSSRVAFPASASAPVVTRSKPRQRRTSGVFGSIAAFFHSSRSSNATASDDEPNPYVPELQPAKSGRWKTRTDRHLSRGRRDSSDDELRITYPRTLPPDPTTSAPESAGDTPRLKKKTTKRNTMQAPPKHSALEDRGWASDAAPTTKANGTIKKKKPEAKQDSPKPSSPAMPNGTAPKHRKAREVEILKISDERNTPPSPLSPAPQSLRGKKPNGTALPTRLPTEAALSRNSSLSKQSVTSAASAPINMSASATTIHPTDSSFRHSAINGHRRATSLDANTPRPNSEGTPKGHQRGLTATRANGEVPSLMSIVEGVAKQNREHRDPNSMLFLPKAPPPISPSLDFDNIPNSPSTVTPQKAAHKHVPRLERTPSERSVPLTPSIPPASAPVIHQPSSPEMKPLRSALRNNSRSPSPQVHALPPAIPARSPQRPPPTPVPPVKELMSASTDDVSSISSYETTRELFDDASDTETPVQTFATPMMFLQPAPPAIVSTPESIFVTAPATPTPPTPPTPQPELPVMLPPVPPKSPQPNGTANGTASPPNQGGSDISKSTDSSNGMSPRRQKSVRMSLPPTFSATPPAVEDSDDKTPTEHAARRRYEPWSSPPNGDAHQRRSDSGGWSSRIRERDIWQDSSEDEDEEYSKAKRMLSRLSSSSSKKHR